MRVNTLNGPVLLHEKEYVQHSVGLQACVQNEQRAFFHKELEKQAKFSEVNTIVAGLSPEPFDIQSLSGLCTEQCLPSAQHRQVGQLAS